MTKQKLIDLMCKIGEFLQPITTVFATKYAWVVAAGTKLLELYKAWRNKK